jgi:hypothetical protein
MHRDDATICGSFDSQRTSLVAMLWSEYKESTGSLVETKEREAFVTIQQPEEVRSYRTVLAG